MLTLYIRYGKENRNIFFAGTGSLDGKRFFFFFGVDTARSKASSQPVAEKKKIVAEMPCE